MNTSEFIVSSFSVADIKLTKHFLYPLSIMHFRNEQGSPDRLNFVALPESVLVHHLIRIITRFLVTF